MNNGWMSRNEVIHRHTGGLEIRWLQNAHFLHIHRHTGGLEISKKLHCRLSQIHRHTGGLERLQKMVKT